MLALPPQLLDQRQRRFGGLAVVEVKSFDVLHLEERRLVAACQAHHRLNREHAVRRGVAEAYSQVLAKLACESLRAAQRARKIGADLNAIFATWLVVIEGVEADQRANLSRIEVQQYGHLRHRRPAQVAVFPLSEVEQRHDRRSPLVWRILGEYGVDFGLVFLGEQGLTPEGQRASSLTDLSA